MSNFSQFYPYPNRWQGGSRQACAAAIGHITESMPRRHTPRKINGATEDGRSMPAARPQAAMAPPYFVIESRLASVVEPTLSTPPAQRSFASGLAGPGELGAVDHLGGAEALEIVGLRHPPGGRDDVIAELREHGGGDRADAAGGAGHHDRAARRASGRASPAPAPTASRCSRRCRSPSPRASRCPSGSRTSQSPLTRAFSA